MKQTGAALSKAPLPLPLHCSTVMSLCLGWAWFRNPNTSEGRARLQVSRGLPAASQWVMQVQAFSSWGPTSRLYSEEGEAQREHKADAETEREKGGPFVNKGSFR